MATVAYEFIKNGSEVVRATVQEYDGRAVVDLRVFAARASGEPVPTRKGLTISRDKLPELEAAVKALRAAADGEPVAALAGAEG